MRPTRSLFLTAALAAPVAFGAGTAFAQQPVLKTSPFLPPASAAKPATAAPTDLEFTGVLLAGPQTQVCITRKQVRRSSWIRVGDSSDGIEVVSHDAPKESVVVRVGGVTHELKLKTAAPMTAAAPAATLRPVVAPVALPSAAGTLQAPLIDPPPPVTIAEKEREARMLVSDLLEIGMQQRKAYAEAQRKAALEAAQKASATKSPTAPR